MSGKSRESTLGAVVVCLLEWQAWYPLSVGDVASAMLSKEGHQATRRWMKEKWLCPLRYFHCTLGTISEPSSCTCLLLRKCYQWTWLWCVSTNYHLQVHSASDLLLCEIVAVVLRWHLLVQKREETDTQSGSPHEVLLVSLMLLAVPLVSTSSLSGNPDGPLDKWTALQLNLFMLLVVSYLVSLKRPA